MESEHDKLKLSPAASVAGALANILTGYAVEVQSGRLKGNAASVAKALASFAADMASVAKSPASDLERATAGVAASVASVLSEFAKTLK